MRLTVALFFKKTVPGSLFRGKNRLVRKVKFAEMEKKRIEYERQEKIMNLLKHPYLSMVSFWFLLIFVN